MNTIFSMHQNRIKQYTCRPKCRKLINHRIKYISNQNLETYVISENDELVGFFELLYNPELKETEISYFGLLEEYIGKGIGGYALSVAITKSFEKNIKRVWLHTCTLDHPNALKNYKARGMTVFRKENINILDS